MANVLTIALFESDQPHMIVLYLISPTFNDNDQPHLSKDNVSIANRSRPVVQVQNAVSTKEARPVRELNWYSIYLMYYYFLGALIFDLPGEVKILEDGSPNPPV